MNMRSLINGLKVSRPYRATLFHGTKSQMISIDPTTGAEFTNFDEAANAGPVVHECEINLRNAFYATDASDLKDCMIEVSHGAAYDGCVVRGKNSVIVFDENCLTEVQIHDAFCDLEGERMIREELLQEFRPEAGQHIVFVTGQLAKSGLERVLAALEETDFTYEIRALDIPVAAWLTTESIGRDIGDLEGVDLVIIPGKVTGSESDLQTMLGVHVMRGPACYSELPTFFEHVDIVVSPDGVVRPKIVMLGGQEEYAVALSTTYEIPRLTLSNMMASLGSEDALVVQASKYVERGEEVPHFLAAEIVRSRLMMPDTQKGFVMDGYPATVRDAQWFDEMNVRPDAIVCMDSGNENAVADHYATAVGFVRVDMNGPKSPMGELYTKVETLLRSCVK